MCQRLIFLFGSNRIWLCQTVGHKYKLGGSLGKKILGTHCDRRSTCRKWDYSNQIFIEKTLIKKMGGVVLRAEENYCFYLIFNKIY